MSAKRFTQSLAVPLWLGVLAAGCVTGVGGPPPADDDPEGPVTPPPPPEEPPPVRAAQG